MEIVDGGVGDRVAQVGFARLGDEALLALDRVQEAGLELLVLCHEAAKLLFGLEAAFEAHRPGESGGGHDEGHEEEEALSHASIVLANRHERLGLLAA